MRLAEDGRHTRAGETPIEFNPADLAALRLALALAAEAESGGGGTVLALAVGPLACEEPLRLALAAGAGAALRVCRPDGEDGPPGTLWPAAPDGSAAHTRIAAKAAAAAIVSRKPALVLTGAASGDTAHGCFGAFLAAALGASFAHRAAELVRDGAGWRVRVKLDRGYGQEMRLTPAPGRPAVVTIVASLPPPPDPSLPAWLASRRAEIPAVGAAPDRAAGPVTTLRPPLPRVKSFRAPDRSLDAEGRIRAMIHRDRAAGGGRIVAGASPAVQAEAIFEWLRERGY